MCAHYSRAYLRHLFVAGEVLGLRLAVMHNLWFYNTLMARIRQALEEGTFSAFRQHWSPLLAGRAEEN